MQSTGSVDLIYLDPPDPGKKISRCKGYFFEFIVFLLDFHLQNLCIAIGLLILEDFLHQIGQQKLLLN